MKIKEQFFYQAFVFLAIILMCNISCKVKMNKHILNIDSLSLPKNYTARYLGKEPIKIDGKPTEKVWQHTPWTDDFIDIEGVKKPTYRTRLKMLWSDTHLYFYAELEEHHIWATLKQRDTIIFHNNDFEIFIDPDNDTQNYYEFEINALNTVWDLFLSKPYRDRGKVLNHWDFRGLKTAVNIQGTLNNSNDIDKYWSVEIAMPWTAINETFDGASKPPKDHFWRINFSRVNWDFDLKNGRYSRKKDTKTGKYISEYNWVWSPQGVIAMHEPEKWGFVRFSSQSVYSPSHQVFQYPKDARLQWQVYAWHRQMLWIFNKKRRWDTSKLPEKFRVFGKRVILKKQLTPNGYIIWFTHPLTQKIWSISQRGVLKKS